MNHTKTTLAEGSEEHWLAKWTDMMDSQRLCQPNLQAQETSAQEQTLTLCTPGCSGEQARSSKMWWGILFTPFTEEKKKKPCMERNGGAITLLNKFIQGLDLAVRGFRCTIHTLYYHFLCSAYEGGDVCFCTRVVCMV